MNTPSDVRDTRERIVLNRDLTAVQIPDGSPMTLKAGSPVVIMQALGGSYTVTTFEGFLARIDGRDADALGKPVIQKPWEAEGAGELHPDDLLWVEDQVMAQLKTCFDPEIPIDIIELGLIYMCELTPLPESGFKVDIRMTLTAPGCGMGDVLKSDVEKKVREVPGVKEMDIQMVFDPPWDQSRMSEAAKLHLNL